MLDDCLPHSYATRRGMPTRGVDLRLCARFRRAVFAVMLRQHAADRAMGVHERGRSETDDHAAKIQRRASRSQEGPVPTLRP